MTRVLLSVFLSALAVSAQQASTHTLRGRVLDPSASGVPNAAVRIYSHDNSFQRSARTDVQGAYLFERLPEGEFLVEARTTGLDQASPVAITLTSPDQTLDLALEVRGLATRVVVTAAVTPQSTVESGKAMDVVDRAEMERRQEITFTEAVRELPGLRVQQLGGPGSTTRIQMRGLRAADTGLLVDGMRLRDVAGVQGDAMAFLGDLQLVNTDRIEVLRGLGSSIYGTNTTAGVLNMVTDQGGGKVHGEVGGEGGGLGLGRGVARVAGGAKQDQFQYSLGVAHLNVNGGVDGIEHVRNSSLQSYGLWRPNSTSTLSARLWSTLSTIGVNLVPEAGPDSNLPATGTITAIPLAHSQMLLADQNKAYSYGNATFIPNVYDPDSRRMATLHSVLVQWNQQAAPRFSYHVSYGSFISNRDNRDGPAGSGWQAPYNSSSIFAGRADTAQARADLTLTRWNSASVGYEWEREHYENLSTDQNPDGATNAKAQGVQRSQAVFFQDKMRFFSDRLQIAASGRFQGFQLDAPTFAGGDSVYKNATFSNTPNAWTGDASVSYFIPSTQTKLRAHAGNGFRSPTLYERIGTYFYWGSFTALGDPALRPERTVSFDFGVDHYFSNSRYRVSSSYFYTRLQEVIGYANLVNDPYDRWGGYANMGGALARGVEASIEARPMRKLIVQSSYTYTNAIERNSSFIGGTLSSIRVFPHAFTTIASYELTRRITVSSDLLVASDYISGSFFVGSGNRPYKFAGPRRWDSAFSYTLPVGEHRSLRFHVRAENLLNQEYYEDGFRTPRLWASAGVKFTF